MPRTDVLDARGLGAQGQGAVQPDTAISPFRDVAPDISCY
jgi:hypothetical protein